MDGYYYNVFPGPTLPKRCPTRRAARKYARRLAKVGITMSDIYVYNERTQESELVERYGRETL